MPLMMLNLRALPDGLESHKQFLKEEVESWLRGGGRLEEADVTFICSSVDSDNGETVRLKGHQAVLAPVSARGCVTRTLILTTTSLTMSEASTSSWTESAAPPSRLETSPRPCRGAARTT